jgi:hypothetical protein
MKHTESNPIQQRIEKLGEKWDDTKNNSNLRLVRLVYQDNEAEMVDTFYWYMIGLDTPIEDIAIIFETPFDSIKTYSQDLLKELEKTVSDWNTATKGEGIEDIKIDFTIDRKYENDSNKAAIFVHNFAKLIKSLNLSDDQYGVIILKDTQTNASKLKKWLAEALSFMKQDRIRFLVGEHSSSEKFVNFGEPLDAKIKTIVCDMEMDKAMNQVAAMGDPREPSTSYRIEFMKLYQGIEKRNKEATQKHGNNCIEMATKNAEKDPYWISQIVTVYTALSNDQLGYKNYAKALELASMAVVSAEKTLGLIDDEISLRLVGQTLLYRGSLYCQSKDWFKALDDFTAAKATYEKCKEVVMGIESCRMAAFVAEKVGISEQEERHLADGFILAEAAPKEVAKASSFPLLVHAILKISNFEITTSRIKTLLHNIYGEQWESYINNIYNPELIQN